MPLINCKVELKRKQTKYCILSAAVADNVDANDDNIFPIKGTKLYVPVVTVSARDSQKLLKLLSKEFKRSVDWNEYKTKVRIKIRQISFLNQISLESLDYLFQFIQIEVMM